MAGMAFILTLSSCGVVQQSLSVLQDVAMDTSTTLGEVQQADPQFVANVTSCRRQGNDVLLTFNVRNNTGQTLQDVRIGHTGYYENMEGRTDVGQEISSMVTSIAVRGGNWDGIARFDMPAGSVKTLQIYIKDVATNARNISLQVGMGCENKTFANKKARFTLVPIQ